MKLQRQENWRKNFNLLKLFRFVHHCESNSKDISVLILVSTTWLIIVTSSDPGLAQILLVLLCTCVSRLLNLFQSWRSISVLWELETKSFYPADAKSSFFVFKLFIHQNNLPYLEKKYQIELKFPLVGLNLHRHNLYFCFYFLVVFLSSFFFLPLGKWYLFIYIDYWKSIVEIMLFGFKKMSRYHGDIKKKVVSYVQLLCIECFALNSVCNLLRWI